MTTIIKNYSIAAPYHFERLFIKLLPSLLGSIFLFSAYLKWIDLNSFYIILIKYLFIPKYFVQYSALFIISTEVILAITLCLEPFRKISSLLILVMMICFTVFKTYHFINKTEASCGCFGNLLDGQISFFSILLNLIMIVGAVCIFINEE